MINLFIAFSCYLVEQLCEGDLRYIWSVMSNQNEHYIREVTSDQVKADGIPCKYKSDLSDFNITCKSGQTTTQIFRAGSLQIVTSY